MTSSCYHTGPNRNSDEYQVTNIDAANKRSNKNLFKTAIEKLNKKYRKHKKINDNLYEVIVIYKDKDDTDGCADDRIRNNNTIQSEPLKRKSPPAGSTGPAPPPRTRSRSHSRVSVRSSDTCPPTPPPRSRRNSRSSWSRVLFSHDTIPPTPPPRSRPQSRNSCRGSNVDHTSTDRSERRKPPLAPPRSPFIKERKIRKKVRDDDIKGILDSVIALVSETDLDNLQDEGQCDTDNEVDEIENDETSEQETNQKLDKLDENKNIPDFKPNTEAIYAQVNQEHSKVSAKNLKDRNTVEVHNKASPITEEIRDNSTNTTFSPHNGVDFNNTEHSEAAQIKLGKHEAMTANNERMNFLWDSVKHASNISLNKVASDNNNEHDVKETYIGGHVDALQPTLGYARSQSYTQLAHQSPDCQQESFGGLTQLSPQDRVKRSLERLDVPEWYKEKDSKSREVKHNGGMGWRKDSFSDIDKTGTKSRPRDRSLPPPSPLPSRNRSVSQHNRPTSPTSLPNHHPVSPSSPSSPTNQLRPYLGWRSQEKLPSFLETEKPNKIDQGWRELQTQN